MSVIYFLGYYLFHSQNSEFLEPSGNRLYTILNTTAHSLLTSHISDSFIPPCNALGRNKPGEPPERLIFRRAEGGKGDCGSGGHLSVKKALKSYLHLLFIFAF